MRRISFCREIGPRNKSAKSIGIVWYTRVIGVFRSPSSQKGEGILSIFPASLGSTSRSTGSCVGSAAGRAATSSPWTRGSSCGARGPEPRRPGFPSFASSRRHGRCPSDAGNVLASDAAPPRLLVAPPTPEVLRVLSSISLSDLVRELDDTDPGRLAPRAFAALGRERRQGGSRLR